MRHLRIPAFLAAGVLLASSASAQEPSQPPARPKYQLLQQDEDWSVLAQLGQQGDPFDPVKYVPFGDGGLPWLSFGGHVRVRYESWEGFNFGAAPPGSKSDDQFVMTRVLLHADAHLLERTRVYLEGKSAQHTERELPGGRRALDADYLDLQQAFLDQGIPLPGGGELVLRGGRMMLAFGKQRLVSPLPWANALRAWEGLEAILRTDGWKVTALATRFVPVDKTEFNEGDEDDLLFGVYAEHPSAGTSTELYWLGIDRADQAFNGTAGDETRHTLGGRAWGALGGSPLDYEVEAALQVGEVGSEDVLAWMVASELSHTFADAAGAPRVRLGLDYASGDPEAGGDVETFNQLFPLGHAYFGMIDAIGRQNILDVSAGVSFKPAADWKVSLDGHAFWLADENDALYNAGGLVVRPGGSSGSTEVGTEIDLVLSRQVGRHLTAEAGYGHFFAGQVLSDSGPDEDTDFAYVSLQLTF